MPTSLFILNPITAMFGAYVFEAGDMPVVQLQPGCAKVKVNVSEAIPVVGLGSTLPSETRGSITQEQALKIALGMTFMLRRGGDPDINKSHLGRAFLDRINDVFKIKESTPLLPLSRKPLKSFDEYSPPNIARRVLTFVDRENNIRNTHMEPWSDRLVEKSKDYWTQYLRWQGSYYHTVHPDVAFLRKRSASYLITEGVNVALLRYLDPGLQKSGRTDGEYLGLVDDPVSDLTKLLDRKREGFTTLGSRFEFIKGDFVSNANIDRDSILKAIALIPEYIIPDAQKFLSDEGLFTGDLRAVIDTANSSLDKDRGFGSHAVRTYMLYPDLVLPTIRQALGISSAFTDDDVAEHLVRFVPTYAECGRISANEALQHRAARSLDDLADPDIWFARDIQDVALQYASGNGSTYNKEDDAHFGSGRTPTTRNLKVGTSFLPAEGSNLKNAADLGRMETVDFLAAVDIEQLSKPNRKRMLFAFPTYIMEFTLDGVKSKRLTQSAQLPLNWEARLLNFLPIMKLSVNLDCHRPNVADVSFISRRAALRNESWHWLQPDIEIDEDVFTNIPNRVMEILNEDFPTRSDPTLLTKLVLAAGTRVSVRMGYGCDINSLEMLPTILSGTIGEIALGEVSSMKIQDIGMQLLNPLEKTIGATGNYSPNRIWSGKYTMRAFTDIFNGLDTKFMGRSGRGTAVDLVTLTDQEVKRIYDIGVQTRTSVEYIRANYAEEAMGIMRTIFHSPVVNFLRWWNPALLLGQAVTNSEAFGVASDLLRDKTSRFYPELLNVYPCVTGVSDWAISNTDAKGIQATYWIDMLARLNPGSVWWTHPFGNESRLFFGRPEQFYRKHPTVIAGDKLSAFYTQIAQSTSNELEAKQLSPRNLAERITTTTESVRGVQLKHASYYGYEPKNRAEAASALVTFEAALNSPDTIDELYRHVWSQLARIEVQAASGVEIEKFLLGTYTRDEIESLLDAAPDKNQPPRSEPSTLAESGRPIPREAPGPNAAGWWVVIYAYVNNLTHLLTAPFVAGGLIDRATETSVGDYHSDFGGTATIEAFSRYLKRITSTALYQSDGRRDLTQLPAEASTTIGVKFWHGIPKFAGVLISALRDEYITDALAKFQQVTRPLSRARSVMGYRRFRQFHHVLSGRDLLTNRLKTSQAKMSNAVQVDTYTVGYSVLPFERRVISLEADMENLNFGIFQWFKGLLGENDRDHVLGILIPNALARGMARMYDGIIEIRGNPQVKPHDVLYILDLHNGVYGPVKCKTVMHTIDSVQGFVTRIVPELHTESFSSRVLSEHVAEQRIMKTIAAGALVSGIGLALLGGPIGITAGIGLAAGSAALFTYASLSDTIARRQLVNFSAAETLGNAQSERDLQLVMKAMMLDTFVSSNKISSINPVGNEEQNLISRMTNINRPELGVSIFPLMRFGSYAPIVAGLKTEGLVSVDTSFSGVTTEAAKIVKGAILEAFDATKVLDYIGENIVDVQSGWRATVNAIKRELESKARTEAALRRRGVEVR